MTVVSISLKKIKTLFRIESDLFAKCAQTLKEFVVVSRSKRIDRKIK